MKERPVRVDRQPLGSLVLPKDNEKRAKEKLKRFSEAGPKKLVAVFDFDRTMTTGKMNHGHGDRDITILDYFTSQLPHEARRKQLAITDGFLQLEKNNGLTHDHAEIWWAGPFSLYAEHGLNFYEKMPEFLKIAKPRPQVIEVFNKLKELDIPTIIVSGGIKDVIDLWCDKYGINPELVVSTKLHLDENGKIIGWDEENLVHVLNKKDKAHEKITQFRSDRPLTLLIGDSLDDAKVVDGNGDVLRIRIREPWTDENPDEKDKFRQETFTKFDALIESGEFSEVLNFLNSLEKPENPIPDIPPARSEEIVVFSYS